MRQSRALSSQELDDTGRAGTKPVEQRPHSGSGVTNMDQAGGEEEKWQSAADIARRWTPKRGRGYPRQVSDMWAFGERVWRNKGPRLESPCRLRLALRFAENFGLPVETRCFWTFFHLLQVNCNGNCMEGE